MKMSREDKITKLMFERLDALEELRRFKKILTSRIAKIRIDNQIKELCGELDRLSIELNKL